MHLVILHLMPTGTAALRRIEPSELANAIRARAGPAEAPEHVSARIAPPGLHVGLFYRTESEEKARECAEQLTRRVVEEMPMFAGWQVDGTEPGAFQ
jgi:hypothetical protein